MRKTVGITALVALLATFGWTSVASAMAFTLDQVININDATTGVVGQLRPVTDGFGGTDTSGAHTDTGTVDFGTQDIFVVDLVLSGGSASVDSFSVSVGVSPFAAPVGGGYFNDGGSLVSPSSVAVNAGFSFATEYFFSPSLAGGETTVRLFSTYTGGMAETQTATFMISSGTNFSVGGTIVPEPSTALLVGCGLLAVGAARRTRVR